VYPHLIQIGFVAVPTYGVFAAVALVTGLTLAMYTAAKLIVPPDKVWNLGLIAVASAVIGLRLVLVLGHWHDFLAYPLLLLSVTIPATVDTVLLEIGFGLFAGLLYMTWKQMPWLRTLDAIAPGWALGQALLMTGCFFAGCRYGRPTAMPWGVVFHSRWALLWNQTPLEVRLHPAQLYFAVLQFVLCAALLWWLPRRRQAGELAGLWLFLSGLAQYFLDFYRGDRLMVFGGVISLMQAIDVCMLLVGTALLLQRSSWRGNSPAEVHG
jgi:phosphatidylglycerol:prolipoprotein diacylglycerol transferase